MTLPEGARKQPAHASYLTLLSLGCGFVIGWYHKVGLLFFLAACLAPEARDFRRLAREMLKPEQVDLAWRRLQQLQESGIHFLSEGLAYVGNALELLLSYSREPRRSDSNVSEQLRRVEHAVRQRVARWRAAHQLHSAQAQRPPLRTHASPWISNVTSALTGRLPRPEAAPLVSSASASLTSLVQDAQLRLARERPVASEPPSVVALDPDASSSWPEDIPPTGSTLNDQDINVVTVLGQGHHMQNPMPSRAHHERHIAETIAGYRPRSIWAAHDVLRRGGSARGGAPPS